MKTSKSILHYTRGITPKHITSGAGSISATERLSNTVPKKRRSGGEPLATLFDRPGTQTQGLPHRQRCLTTKLTDCDLLLFYQNVLLERKVTNKLYLHAGGGGGRGSSWGAIDDGAISGGGGGNDSACGSELMIGAVFARWSGTLYGDNDSSMEERWE